VSTSLFADAIASRSEHAGPVPFSSVVVLTVMVAANPRSAASESNAPSTSARADRRVRRPQTGLGKIMTPPVAGVRQLWIPAFSFARTAITRSIRRIRPVAQRRRAQIANYNGFHLMSM